MHFMKRGHCGPNHRGRFGHHEGGGMFGHRGPGGGGMGGPRRGKRFSGDELRLMVLALLEGEPQHGYQLIRSFAARSGDAYAPSPGNLYPLLTMLADMGLIAEAEGSAGTSRRSYALTDEGRAELETGRAVASAAFARLEEMAAMAGRTDGGPVRRAMMNLRTATVQRISREGGTDELGFAIAAILDEAAQKIERLDP